MNSLKEACLLTKTMTNEELEVLSIFVGLVMELRQGPPKFETPPEVQEYGQKLMEMVDAQEALPPIETLTKAKAKRSKAKPAEEHKLRGGGHGQEKGKAKTGPHTGALGKVMEALTQTTGKISAVDLAEVLEMDRTKVNNVLTAAMYNEVPGLKREPGISTNDKGKQVKMYLYWLDSKEAK